MKIFGQEQEFDYKDMLVTIMETPQDAKGATIEEIRKSIRVIDALEKSNEELVLEDNDYAFMMGKVNSTKFTSANKVILDFVEDLKKAAEDV